MIVIIYFLPQLGKSLSGLLLIHLLFFVEKLAGTADIFPFTLINEYEDGAFRLLGFLGDDFGHPLDDPVLLRSAQLAGHPDIHIGHGSPPVEK
jgi:hypothetical protein